MVKRLTAILMMPVLSPVACAPAAPTPTPEPKPTPVWVRATKPEHLEGLWKLPEPFQASPPTYYRRNTDGTVSWTWDSKMATNLQSAKFWFEDGLYHEDESPRCDGVGIYEMELEILGARAARLRLNVIEDDTTSVKCLRPSYYQYIFSRVD